MRLPSPSLAKFYLRFIVSFILGMIVGSIIFLFIHGQSMEELLLENRQLHSTNNILSEDLEAEKKTSEELTKRTQQTLLVKSIDISVLQNKENSMDGFMETEVIDLLREDLKFLIGLPLESIAETHDTIVQLVNSKKYVIRDKEVALQLETLIIHTTLSLDIRVESPSL